MTPDLYGAWLTAGTNLQPAGDWVVRNWPNLAIAVALAVFAAWSIGRALRDANTRINTILADLDTPRQEDR